MNISNIILELQKISQTTEDTLTLMTISKIIEKLEVGKVEVVDTVGDLPSLPLNVDGQIYLVENDDQLYYNVGSDWIVFPVEVNPPILYAWGRNSAGRLGDGTTINRSSPVTIVGGITNWSQISVGGIHSLGLTSDGILYAWGSNSSFLGAGTLGDGTTIDRSSPVTVVGGITNWSEISVGFAHSLGLTSSGILYAWGATGYGGVLGDGTYIARSSPVTVVGGITNWSGISGGFAHSVGVTSTGIIYAWGNNTFYTGGGQLGDNTTISKSSPVTVVGGITNWSQGVASYFHSLGLTSDGILYAWGRASYGRLGDNTTINKSSPVTVVGGITNWSQISADPGGQHTLGLTNTGILYAWGSNSGFLGAGTLGDGTTIDRSSPVTVVGGITNWSGISAGNVHSLGLTSSGILYAWGQGSYGRLGDGTNIARSSPVTVVGGITNWNEISAGNIHSLGLVPASITSL